MERRLLLVAGGTGGHIWPAISLGRWIERNRPGVSVGYVCGMRQLELDIYSSAGIDPQRLPLEGSPFSGGGILNKLSRIEGLFSSFGKARRLIKQAAPDCCVLFGGYLSFPVLMVCLALKIPVVMHEQNAYAGKVTRIASKLGVEIFTGWSECIPLPLGKYTRIGVPVRVFEKIDRSQAWHKLGLPGDVPAGPMVVAFTGSLGSMSIKEFICDTATTEQFKNWTFILPAVSESVEKIGENIYLLPNIWDASLLFSLADMAVIRAGGSTLTEVGTIGIPSIVIPWRGAADDHQYHNAVAFLAENAGILWDSGSDNKMFAKKLAKLYEISKDRRQIMASKLYNSAGRICEDFWLALSSHF